MYESGRIVGKGEEINESLETAERLLDCNGERHTRRHKGSKGRVINTPFPPTYNNRWNHLKLVIREQDKIGWDNLIKGRMGIHWIEYVKKHIQKENIKLQAQLWAPNMILALWNHMIQMWQCQNDALHEDDNKRVAPIKVEALDREQKRILPWQCGD
jgi:hypothetical protein